MNMNVNEDNDNNNDNISEKELIYLAKCEEIKEWWLLIMYEFIKW